MLTIAPTRAPIPIDPAAQPISAPRPTPVAVVPTRTPPAPAGLKEGREAGSMQGEHTKPAAELVTAQSRLIERIASNFVRTGVRPRPRPAACPRSGPEEGVWGNREVPPATEMSP